METLILMCETHVIQCGPIEATKVRCQYEYTELLKGLIFDRAYGS